jgi:hypothetical protein
MQIPPAGWFFCVAERLKKNSKISKKDWYQTRKQCTMALYSYQAKERNMFTVSRPAIGDEHVSQIKRIMEENPGINRYHLSLKVCELWNWRFPSGDPKDMSCRSLLRKLDSRGEIELPESNRGAIAHGNKPRTVPRMEHNTAPVGGCLRDILPLSIDIVDKAGAPEFASMLAQYHYLGFDRTIGRNMKYMVRDRGGRPVALLLFGAAAWKCKDRDSHIGWDASQRQDNLHLITNNTRYLIPQWVRIPHLASYALSRVSKRISADWQLKYGHPILCLETFVELGRFRGTAYKAANWIYVGKTAGRGRNDFHKLYSLPIKDIYLYPLAKDYRKLLRGT